jgi:WD40 repeat protein
VNGLTLVWDLKTNKPIFNFQNQQSSGEVQVSLVWNPEIPTQICVGYSDEQETQIWDLRQSQGPVIQFDNSFGVSSLDWCQQDPNLILLANKDCSVNIWNYRSGVRLGSIQLDQVVFASKFNATLFGSFSLSMGHKSQIYLLKPSHLDGYVFQWLKKTQGIAVSNNAKMVMF